MAGTKYDQLVQQLLAMNSMDRSLLAMSNPDLANAGGTMRGINRPEVLGLLSDALKGSGDSNLITGGTSNLLGKMYWAEEPGVMDYVGAAGEVPGVGTAAKGLTAGLGLLGTVATQARKGVGKSKKRVGTTGKYVGAPSHVDSPQKLAAMRKNYMSQVEAGVAGAPWYDESSKWIQTVTPDNQRGQALADTLGVTSQGTGVDTNLGFTVKAFNQRAAGEPVQTGRFPGTQSPLIEQVMDGNRAHLGPKRQPFADNLSVAWNPEMAQHPVHDIWQGRAMGYTHPNGKPWDAGFSPQQHAFMDEEMQHMAKTLNEKNVGGISDWGPLNTQAAAWTGAKINAGELSPADAAKHYGDFANKYTAFGTHEQVPGAGIGHLPNMVDESFDARMAYQNDPRSSWVNEKGQDNLYTELGLLTAPSNRTVGAYTPSGTGVLEVNPGEAARPLVQMEGKAGEKLVSPRDRALLDAAEGTRAYIDAQNAGAWHKPIYGNKAGVSSSLHVPMEGSPSPEQMGQLSDLATGRGMFAVDTGQGVNLINDPWSQAGAGRTGTTLAKELKGDMGSDLQKVTGDTQAERITADTGYLDYEDAWRAGEGSGEATKRLFEYVGDNPAVMQSLDNSPAIRQKALANLERDAEIAAQTGQPIRQDIQNARRIIAEKGFSALKAALDRGEVLPAVFAASVAPLLYGYGQSSPETL